MHATERVLRLVCLTITTVLIFVSSGMVWGSTQEHQAGQYKKQNRNQVTAIATGRAESALKYSRNYLAKYPRDLEALYIQTLAYSHMNETGKAMTSLRKALKLGMPFSRFLAGPRNLLEPLYKTEDFQELARAENVLLLHGPVVGSVTATSARFWMRTVSEYTVKVHVSQNSNMRGNVVSGVASSREQDDYTCVVEVKGLAPDTRYFYQIEIDGKPIGPDPQPAFRTFPSAGGAADFSIGFGGGAGYTPWYEHMWLTILERPTLAFLLLGDNVYIDTPKVSETQRYCYYRRQSRPEYGKFAAATPIYAIWDDHDFGENDCTSSLKLDSPPWKLDVLKVFKQNFVNPSYGNGVKNPGCWFDFSIGDVDFFLLDCRFYRQNPKKNQRPSMLGHFQKQWLFQKLRKSTAAFKVIASSVPWAPGVKPRSKDTWDGFPDEREDIFSFIEDHRIDGVLLLSADRHRSDARIIPREKGYALYDLMSSRLTNVHTHGLVQNAEGSVFLCGYNKKCSFGLLSFDTTKADPEVTYRIINIDGEVIHSLVLTKSKLSCRGTKHSQQDASADALGRAADLRRSAGEDHEETDVRSYTGRDTDTLNGNRQFSPAPTS